MSSWLRHCWREITFVQRGLLLALESPNISGLIRIAGAKDKRTVYLIELLFFTTMQFVGFRSLFRDCGEPVSIGLPLLIPAASLEIAMVLAQRAKPSKRKG
jgi:hypothetical protein